MSTIQILALAAATFAANPTASPTPSADQQVLMWRQTRVNNLTKADGWLTLIGLHWLDAPRSTVGNGKANAINLGAGPARLGEILLSPERVLTLKIATTAKVQVDGKPAQGEIRLLSDAGGASATQVVFGTVSFSVISRGERLGLRVKDSTAATRTAFKGLDYFDYDPKWRIEGKFERYSSPRTIDVVSIIGTVEPTPNPGRAVFSHQGRSYSLELLEGSDAQHFFTVFGDRTNGKESYGMARFLAGSLDSGGQTVVLDFNTAYNPPCAFTPYATCPMPPEGNRLDVAVRAGERKYSEEVASAP